MRGRRVRDQLSGSSERPFTSGLSSTAVLRSVGAVSGLKWRQESSQRSAAAKPRTKPGRIRAAATTSRFVFNLPEKFSETRVDASACGHARQRKPQTLTELTRSNLNASTSVPAYPCPPVCVHLCRRMIRACAAAQTRSVLSRDRTNQSSARGSGGT